MKRRVSGTPAAALLANGLSRHSFNCRCRYCRVDVTEQLPVFTAMTFPALPIEAPAPSAAMRDEGHMVTQPLAVLSDDEQLTAIRSVP